MSDGWLAILLVVVVFNIQNCTDENHANRIERLELKCGIEANNVEEITNGQIILETR